MICVCPEHVTVPKTTGKPSYLTLYSHW